LKKVEKWQFCRIDLELKVRDYVGLYGKPMVKSSFYRFQLIERNIVTEGGLRKKVLKMSQNGQIIELIWN